MIYIKKINKKILDCISKEKIYCYIPDDLTHLIKENGLELIKDHNRYYSTMTYEQCFTLIPRYRNNNKIKYYCSHCGKPYMVCADTLYYKNDQSFCKKCIRLQSLFKYKNNIAVSQQQYYFYTLFQSVAELNYKINNFYIDIAFLKLKIGIEYNGGGHDLSIRLEKESKSKFIKREWSRRFNLINTEWKMIYLISKKDNINIYSDEEYIQIFNYAYYLLQNENIVSIYLEHNIILTHSKLININDILDNLDNYNNIQFTNIYSVNQAAKYLYVSTDLLLTLHNKKKLLMNKSEYEFRYYTQEQLDEYKINNENIDPQYYLLYNELANYANINQSKIFLLKKLRKLYPKVINDEVYYLKKDIDKCIESKILDNYFTFNDIANYMNVSKYCVKDWFNKYQIEPEVRLTKTIIFFTKEQVNQFILEHDELFLTLEKISELIELPLNEICSNAKDIKCIYINGKKYFFKDRVVKIFDRCSSIYNADEAEEYLNIGHHSFRYYVSINNIKHTVFNRMNFFKKEDLDAFSYRKQYIESLISRNHAADYLHISFASLDRLAMSGELIPVEKNGLYSKEQLDEYLKKKGIYEFIAGKDNIDNSYLMIGDIVNQYHIDERKLRRLIESGEIKAVLYYQKYYVHVNDIKAYIKQREYEKSYLMKKEILEKFNIKESELRYLSDTNRIRKIKKKNYNLFHEDDIREYININERTINSRECFERFGLKYELLKKLRENNILVPEAYHNSILYDINKVETFCKNIDKIFININDLRKLKKGLVLDLYVIHRFRYALRQDVFKLIRNDLLEVNISMKKCLEKYHLYVFEYDHKYYVIKDKYISLKSILRKRVLKLLRRRLSKIRVNDNYIEYNGDEVITLMEAGKMLGRSYDSMYSLIRYKKLHYTKYNGDTYLFLSEIKEYIKDNNINNKMTFNEVMEIIGVSHNTLEKYLAKNSIQYTLIKNKRYYCKEDIRKLVECLG